MPITIHAYSTLDNLGIRTQESDFTIPPRVWGWARCNGTTCAKSTTIYHSLYR